MIFSVPTDDKHSLPLYWGPSALTISVLALNPGRTNEVRGIKTTKTLMLLFIVKLAFGDSSGLEIRLDVQLTKVSYPLL